MSTTVTYKGSVIATVSNAVKKLLTKGKYLEDDITITDSGGGGGGAVLETLQVSYTPSETAISDRQTPSQGYDGFDEAQISVAAIPSSYVGSGVTRQAAQTIHPSTSDQSIATNQYLTGAQTIKAVLLTNLLAGNIKKDVVVKVGDSTDDDCVTSVTGTYEGGGGGASYSSGSITPSSNSLTETFDIGDSSYTHFLIWADTSPYGKGVRVSSLGFADFSTPKQMLISSNSSGASSAGAIRWSSLMCFSKSGSTVTISSSGGNSNHFNYFISGITYNWIAW